MLDICIVFPGLIEAGAHRVGGLKDLVVDGETGLLFEAGNSVQLAELMHSLLKDHWKAEEMGLKGKEFVKGKFAIEGVVDKLERVYKEVATAGFSSALETKVSKG